MSAWGAKKATVELNWRTAWQEIADGLPDPQPAEVVALVLQMDDAYHRGDKAGWVALRSRLASQPSWTGPSPRLTDSPAATPGKLTAPGLFPDFPM
jgi:hypothetical protein